MTLTIRYSVETIERHLSRKSTPRLSSSRDRSLGRLKCEDPSHSDNKVDMLMGSVVPAAP
jgi:hypothetical protein